MLKRMFHTSFVRFIKRYDRWWENESNLSFFEKHGIERADVLQAKTLLDKEFCCIKQNAEFLEEAKVPMSINNLLGAKKIAATDIETLSDQKLIPDLNVTDRFREHLPEFDYNHELPMPSYSGISAVYNRKIQYFRRQFPYRTDTAWPEDIQLETELTLLSEQRRVLRQFFAQFFSTSLYTMDRLLYSYMTDCNLRGVRSVLAVLAILEKNLDFPKDKILRNFFLINVPAERLLDLIDKVPKIGQVDFKTAVGMTPRILAKTSAELLGMEQAFEEYGIKSTSPCRVHVMTLTPSTLRTRLKKISQGEMKPFLKHPRICEVLIYFNKACQRLREIEARGMKCVSLHVLVSTQKFFDRYLSEGVDRTHCCQDVLHYLAEILGSNRKHIHEILKRHPLRFFVPLADCMATTEVLLERGISKEAILESVPIVLYPRENVLRVLDMIENDKDLNSIGFSGGFVQSDSMFRAGSKFRDRRVDLCLYFLEVPFHFTGDGAMRASNKL